MLDRSDAMKPATAAPPAWIKEARWRMGRGRGRRGDGDGGAAVTAAGECEAVGAGINSSKRRGRPSWEGIGGPRRRWQGSRSKETEGADGGNFFFPPPERGGR